jgi:hypothetical protein
MTLPHLRVRITFLVERVLERPRTDGKEGVEWQVDGRNQGEFIRIVLRDWSRHPNPGEMIFFDMDLSYVENIREHTIDGPTKG